MDDSDTENKPIKVTDLAGIGRIAEAIPDHVYERSIDTICDTFEALIAPLTETTTGWGRILHQKFDNMVKAQKAAACYTIKQAIDKAKRKAEKMKTDVRSPIHPKSFIRSIEEASIETDPTLHEMWENILASQLVDDNFHPHYVELLSHFSPAEAKLLNMLVLKNEVGDHDGGYMTFDLNKEGDWIRKVGDKEIRQWDIPCLLLCQFNLAGVLAAGNKHEYITILYRTSLGQRLLEAVSE